MEFEQGSPGSPDDQGRQLAWAKCGKSKFEMELRSVEAVVAALNAAEVRYLIVGGLAVNAHGYQRTTVDLDMVIQLHTENLLRGMKALGGLGYAPRIPVSIEQFSDPIQRESWRSEKGMLVFQLHSDQHKTTPIDIFVYEPFDFNFEYDRSIEESVAPGINARIIGFEVLLEMKRTANRLKDQVDLEALQKIAPYKS